MRPLFESDEQMAACNTTFRMLWSESYSWMLDLIEPRDEIPLGKAAAIDCRRSDRRRPCETKGQHGLVTTVFAGPCYTADGSSC
jgi:hypothetical protein